MPDSLRLDVWLDIACLFKTRSEAQRACKIGRVMVNGAVAKPHRDLRVGDEIVLTRPGGRRQIVTVRGLSETHVAKADARGLYDDRTPLPTPEEVEMRKLERLFAATARAAPRLNRRNRHDAARRKWTT